MTHHSARTRLEKAVVTLKEMASSLAPTAASPWHMGMEGVMTIPSHANKASSSLQPNQRVGGYSNHIVLRDGTLLACLWVSAAWRLTCHTNNIFIFCVVFCTFSPSRPKHERYRIRDLDDDLDERRGAAEAPAPAAPAPGVVVSLRERVERLEDRRAGVFVVAPRLLRGVCRDKPLQLSSAVGTAAGAA